MHTTWNTAVKTLNVGEGRVGGYLVVWGDPGQRDLQGEYFTPETELGLDWYSRRPVLYHHGLDGNLKAAVIGEIDTLVLDEVGVWAEAQLDLRQRYVHAVRRLVEKGILAWSSGSLPQLVEVGGDGRIKRWPIVEGSLTPTPAEPRRTDVRTLKSAYAALGAEADWHNIQEQCEDTTGRVPTNKRQHQEDIMQDEITLNERGRKRLPIASEADANKSGSITVASPFDRLDALDMLHGYVLLRAAKSFQGVSERYANALAHKINKAGLSGIKADELSYSTQTGFGDEWVPDLWSAQIWEKARLDNVILPLFRGIEMPSNPFELPIEGADPSVYFVPETKSESELTLGAANTIPDSKIGSGKVQLNARKLALRVGFSAELVEDAVVPVLNIYREQAVRAIADSLDYVLLNGDTTNAATGNINSDNADPADTERYLAFDGLRKLPIVTNTANAIDATTGDATGAVTLAKLRAVRFLMTTRYAARPADLAWVVDGNTYAKLLGLSEFLTMDKAGALATAMTGQIGFVDGIPVFMSAEMPLTDADGKVTSAGSNTKGTALCVYRPGWMVGYRRRIAVNVDYLPYYDSYQLTATVRVAFNRFDNEVASVLYNISV
ncbi:MAG: phage major capsid protein [bacterium]|nr:phage major capsid protein [bacterium]